MNREYLVVFLLFLSSTILGYQTDLSTCTVVDKIEARNSYISVLEDAHGTKFILKQKKNRHAIMELVLDKLGCDMAESLGIPCNHVEIIPWNVRCVGKQYPQSAATLHTFIPGQPAMRGPDFLNLEIHQGFFTAPKDERGLALAVIKNMARHPDLPLLCALDTYAGNTDRCCDNVMYDKKTNHFYAFDFSEAFRAKLCKVSCYQMKRLQKGLYQSLSREEKEALRTYRNALMTLIVRHHPDSLNIRLDEYVHAVFSEQELKSLTVQHKIRRYKKYLRHNYKHALAYLAMLNEVIALGWDDLKA